MRDTPSNYELRHFLGRKPWGLFLRDVDLRLQQETKLYCLGGFVLQVLYDVPRVTGDLDYLEVFPGTAATELEKIAGQGSTLARKHKVFLHYTGHVEMSEDYEERLELLDLGLEKLRLYAPDPYDLLLSKMHRNSSKDREDAKFLIKKLGLKFAPFRERFDKELTWTSNRPYKETTVQLWREFFPE